MRPFEDVYPDVFATFDDYDSDDVNRDEIESTVAMQRLDDVD